MRKRTIWLVALAIALISGGVFVGYQYWYHNVRQTAEGRAAYFMNRCCERDYETARMILEKHPNIVNVEFGFMRVLHAAAMSFGDTKPLELLLDHGADINAEDMEGRTALDCALERGNVSTAEFLQARGGRRSAKVRTLTTDQMIERLRDQLGNENVHIRQKQ